MNDPKTKPPATTRLGTDGRYVLQRELGRGTMGVVHEAFDIVLGRTVAVKTIEITFTAGEELREEFERRFFTEARVAAQLSHPGIVVCHDVGKDPKTGKLFIVLERLKGRTLDQYVAAGPMAWRDAVSVVARVARAIHHAHEHGVIHRDLKPANIMLLDSGDAPGSRPDGDAAIKIMDFGVAKVESTGVRLTAAGQFFGSPLYMSPEQALGIESNARSDIFSLGSILCTVLLGRPCFGAPNIPAILGRVVHEDAPVLSTLLPGLPVALDRIVARAMAKRPEDRYPTSAAMAEDLEDILAVRMPRRTNDGTASAPTHTEGVLAALVDEAPPSPVEEKAHAPSPVPQARARSGRGAKIATVGLVGASVITGAFLVWRFTRPSPVPPTSFTPRSTPAATSTPPTIDATMETPLAPDQGVSANATPSATPEPVPPTPTPMKTAPRPTSVPPTQTVHPSSPAAGRPMPTRIRLDVQHPFKSGRLVVWIDGLLVFQTSLNAPVTKRMLEVVPGPHEVRVEMTWEDKRRVDARVVDVAEGSTGLLEVRVAGIGKIMRLKWTSLAPP